MLEMELNRLYFRFDMIDVARLDGEIEKRCYEHLQTCFKAHPNHWNDKTWDDAYCIEKQIAMVLSGDSLRHEIKTQLREAVDRKARDALVWSRTIITACAKLLMPPARYGAIYGRARGRPLLAPGLSHATWAWALNH